MRELISITVTKKDGSSKNYDWYENNSASLEDCFDTEQDLTWYVLESIANDDRFDDAVRIEADSVLMDGSKVVKRISCTVRN